MAVGGIFVGSGSWVSSASRDFEEMWWREEIRFPDCVNSDIYFWDLRWLACSVRAREEV